METIYKSVLTLDIALFTSLLIFYFIKKDSINPVLGYRTKRAMKNKRNWDFAQNYFSKNWLYSIPIIFFTQIPLLFDSTLEEVLPISLLNFVIYSIYLIYVTEKKLKEIDNKNQ